VQKNVLISDDVGPLKNIVRDLTISYENVWNRADSGFPGFDRLYTKDEQISTETTFSSFLDGISDRLDDYPVNREQRDSWCEEIVDYAKASGRSILDLSGAYLDSVLSDAFLGATRSFITDVRSFNPRQEIGDVYQAVRNVWIMNTLQMYMNIPVCSSPSVFAYSMLYPYTDNINDNADFAESEKRSFNIRLKQWLEGVDVTAANGHEEKVRRLIRYIEDQYPRQNSEAVYQSLLSIYNAQVRSLSLQQNSKNVPESIVLNISFEKGGTSVLADGFLVNDKLNFSQQSFCFGFGTFLQISDDLQDIRDDLKNGHMTVYSMCAGKRNLDAKVNKLMNFMNDVIDMNLNGDSDSDKLRELILRNCNFLIMEAVSRNSAYFSEKYLENFERYSPVRFAYLSRLRANLKKRVVQSRNTGASLDMISAILLSLSKQDFNTVR